MIPGGSTPGTSTLIGVGIAILANCLVCAALNLQRSVRPTSPRSSASLSYLTGLSCRLAHLRRARKTDPPRPAASSTSRGRSPARPRRPPHERTPLIVTTKPTLDRSLSDPLAGPANPVVLVPSHLRTDSPPPLLHRRASSRRSSAGHGDRRPRTDKGFLTSPLWLAGFACLNLGELGNFLAYGFAAPSVVAPVRPSLPPSLSSSPFPSLSSAQSPLTLTLFRPAARHGRPHRQRLPRAPHRARAVPPQRPRRRPRRPRRRRDRRLRLALQRPEGAPHLPPLLPPPSPSLTRPLSGPARAQPTPDEFLSAISRPPFIAYAGVSTVAIAVLAHLSRTKLGDRYVLIDLSLCALAGAFTVLSTKAISSFVNLLFLRMCVSARPSFFFLAVSVEAQEREADDEPRSFEYWITYPVLVVLVGTALLQVNYVNKSCPSLSPSLLCSPATRARARPDPPFPSLLARAQCSASSRASSSRRST